MNKTAPKTDTRTKFVAMRLTTLTKANVDRWFNAKFNKWKYLNSHENDSKEKPFEPLETDFEGNLVNKWYSGRTKYGDELTEKDYIEKELRRLSDLDILKFDPRKFDSYIHYKKKVEFYREHLTKKLKAIEQAKSKSNKHPKIFSGDDNTHFEQFKKYWNDGELKLCELKPITKASVLFRLFEPFITADQKEYIHWVSKIFNFKWGENKERVQVKTRGNLSGKVLEALEELEKDHSKVL